MVRLIEHKEPLKKPGRRRKSNMKERWQTDAKWFEEDEKRHPEKYQSQDEELQVTSKEMEKYLQEFINETDQPSVKEVPNIYGRYRRVKQRGVAQRRARVLRKSRKSTVAGYKFRKK